MLNKIDNRPRPSTQDGSPDRSGAPAELLHPSGAPRALPNPSGETGGALGPSGAARGLPSPRAPEGLPTRSGPGALPTPSPRPRPDRPIQVLLVDDHPAVRYGVGRLITDQPDITAIEEASSASEATSELARWVDVAVIDYHLGDRDGLWLAQEIKERTSPPAVLIYSGFADVELTVAAIVAGADGLLSKAALPEELPIAIRRLARGRQHFPAVPRLIATLLRSRLDPRDQAIFSMLVHGVAPAEISKRLRLAASELRARRRDIVQAIAPSPKRSTVPAVPLDYERSRRRRRYRNTG